jgi:tetratricopeptide (TPR) repeat protein
MVVLSINPANQEIHMNGNTLRRIVAISLAGASAFVAVPASAQQSQNVAWCLNKDHVVAPDLAIGGCTALLKTGGAPAAIVAETYRLRASAYLEKKEYDRAVTDISEAIRVAPKELISLAERGRVLAIKGDYDRAIADFDQVIRQSPQDAYALNNRGWAYSQKGDYTHAIADYDRALGIDPNHALARNNREAAYQAAGRTTGAAPQARRASEDGTTIETAIVISAKTESQGMAAETNWIKRNLPGWKLSTQSLVSGEDDRQYDLFNLNGPNGAKKSIYFDITAFFGKS